YPKALEYYTRALALLEAIGERLEIANITVNIGNVYASISDYPKALEYYSHGLALHEELGNCVGIANATGNIGLVYYSLLDYPKALEYSIRALALHEEIGNRAGVANITGNIGSLYLSLLDYPKALEHYARAIALHEELGIRSGVASAISGLGNVHRKLLEYPKALEHYTRALALQEEIGDRLSAAGIIGNLGSLYSQQAFTEYNPAKAEELLCQAIALGEELGTKGYDAHKSLSELYEQEGRFEEAVTHFKKFQELYQEVQSEEAKKKAIQVEQQRQIAEMEKRTAAERADAEATKRVLHNILPPTIAQRVVRGEEHIAESFESVTVLFADIVGFTVLSQRITPQELVTGLDLLFSQFDELAEKYGLEKIKTIGDAYMAVAGLPESREDHAESAARMAMELVEVVAGFSGLGDGVRLQVRIGLHSGEV
ncbi:MAG: Two-component system-sensor histidine kinase, partial [Chlorobi bacterium OLB7]